LQSEIIVAVKYENADIKDVNYVNNIIDEWIEEFEYNETITIKDISFLLHKIRPTLKVSGYENIAEKSSQLECYLKKNNDEKEIIDLFKKFIINLKDAVNYNV